MLLDFLYQLTPKDLQGTPLQVRTARNTTASAAVVVSLDLYTVPKDSVLIIAALAATLTPGAGQQARSWWAGWREEPGGLNNTMVGDTITHAAAAYAAQGRFHFAIVPPNAVIYAVGTFDAATAANTLDGFVQGILIPRGNVAF